MPKLGLTKDPPLGALGCPPSDSAHRAEKTTILNAKITEVLAKCAASGKDFVAGPESEPFIH